MFFNAHTKVVIGNKELKTIVNISIKHDAEKIGASCDLVVPLNSRIQYVDGAHDFLTAQSLVLFKVGDPITITAWYDGYPVQTVFEGFIYDFVEGQPMTIKCLDYVYFFNLGIFGSKRVLVKKNKKSKKAFASVGTSYKEITLKNLMQHIVDFVNDTIDDKADNTDHVALILPIPDLTLVNITFAMMSPAAILEWFKKELGLNINLLRNNLYVNIASNTTETVVYKTDRNVLSADLQKPEATFQSFKVKAWFVREDGTKDSYEVGDSNGQLKEVFFYKVKRDNTLYQKLATEALNKAKQMRFSGAITTLLYPEAKLYMKADYSEIRYPSRNANYVIVGNDLDINDKGYRRKLKFAYLSEKING